MGNVKIYSDILPGKGRGLWVLCRKPGPRLYTFINEKRAAGMEYLLRPDEAFALAKLLKLSVDKVVADGLHVVRVSTLGQLGEVNAPSLGDIRDDKGIAVLSGENLPFCGSDALDHGIPSKKQSVTPDKDKRFIVAFVGESVTCYIGSSGRMGTYITEKESQAHRYTRSTAEAYCKNPPLKFTYANKPTVLEVSA